MPIIDGVYRNPDRSRKYGLDVGDRVKRRIMNNIIFGNVVSLKGDNNRVQVLWDGSKKPTDEVAEWCCLIDENGLELNNIFWRVMQNFHIGKLLHGRLEFVLKELKINEEQMMKAFATRPHIKLVREGDIWYLKIV